MTDDDFPTWWEKSDRLEEPDCDPVDMTPGPRPLYRGLRRCLPPLNGPDARWFSAPGDVD